MGEKIIYLLFILLFSAICCTNKEKLSLDGQHNFDLDNALLHSEGKPLLIYFNAFACTNCRKVEDTLLKDERIIKLIVDNYEFVVLNVDDRAKIEGEVPRKDVRGKLVKTNGQLNIDYQTRLTRSGSQPVFAIIKNRDFADRQIFTRDREKFIAFLEEE